MKPAHIAIITILVLILAACGGGRGAPGGGAKKVIDKFQEKKTYCEQDSDCQAFEGCCRWGAVNTRYSRLEARRTHRTCEEECEDFDFSTLPEPVVKCVSNTCKVLE